VAFTYEDVVAAAGVGDPRDSQALLASGSPTSIRAMAARFGRVASLAHEATALAGGADEFTAAAYVVDGQAVHDAPAATRVALGDGGRHADEVARLLKGVAEHLEEAIWVSGLRLAAMEEDLGALRGGSDQALLDQAIVVVRTYGSAIRDIVGTSSRTTTTRCAPRPGLCPVTGSHLWGTPARVHPGVGHLIRGSVRRRCSAASPVMTR
jgi:hypothetical protein